MTPINSNPRRVTRSSTTSIRRLVVPPISASETNRSNAKGDSSTVTSSSIVSSLGILSLDPKPSAKEAHNVTNEVSEHYNVTTLLNTNVETSDTTNTHVINNQEPWLSSGLQTDKIKGSHIPEPFMTSSSLPIPNSRVELGFGISSTTLLYPTSLQNYQELNEVQNTHNESQLEKIVSKKDLAPANVTKADADRRSLPPPGVELTLLVEDAKTKKMIPKCHQTSIIRLVDEQWMIPQACMSCQNRKRAAACDRNDPCKPCLKLGITCTTEGFMKVLKAPSTRNTSITSIDPNAVATNSNEPIKRKRSETTDNSISETSTVNTSDGFSTSKSENLPRRSKYRKLDNQDFSHSTRDFSAECEELASHVDSSTTLKSGSVNAEKNSTKEGNKKIKTAPHESYYNSNAQKDKPDPHGRPLVWADKRQQLCETLPYYRAYDSAAYTNNGILYAFMIDQEVGIRDKFTDQIIISKCGGGKTQDDKGKMVQTKNQETSSIGCAFDRAMKSKFPVAVIAGQGNSASPSKLPHYYNVLDWFHVTYVWCEVINGAKSFMARLEKINLKEVSWWAPAGTKVTPVDFISTQTLSQICPACKESSKVIYNAGFTCLKTQCKMYFDFDKSVDMACLDYNSAFLLERTEYMGETPGPISPPLIEATVDDEEFGYETKFKKGIVCPKCRCCIRRLHWRYWICENQGCSFTYTPLQRPMSVANAIKQSRNGEGYESEYQPPKFVCHSSIRTAVEALGLYDVYEYILPGKGDEVAGFIRLFKSNSVINQQPDGPNDLFTQMQINDFGLKRNPARNANGVKEVATSHWAANWGAPYKYGVAQISKGFDEAPVVILKAVKRLTWAGEQALTQTHESFEAFEPFNEMLTIGYFEQTHIGFHDDGEKELGPTVATLSLGADATMSFRPKAKGAVGCFRGTDQTTGKGGRKKQVMLSITLNHGDIVIMHGRDIQKYYEHAVKPHGKLRFALTSRYIDPARMETDADREYSAKAGSMPPGSEKYNYNGDEHTKAIETQNPINHITSISNTLDALRLAAEISAEDEETFLTQRLNALAREKALKAQKGFIHT